MSRDIPHVEAIDLAENGRLRLFVAGLSRRIADEREVQADAATPGFRGAANEVLDALLLAKRSGEENLERRAALEHTLTALNAIDVDAERMYDNLRLRAPELFEALRHLGTECNCAIDSGKEAGVVPFPVRRLSYFVDVSAVEAHEPWNAEKLLQAKVADAYVAEMRMERRESGLSHPQRVSGVWPVTKEPSPHPMRERSILALSRLELRKLLSIGKRVAQNDWRVAAHVAQMLIHPVGRPTDELLDALEHSGTRNAFADHDT